MGTHKKFASQEVPKRPQVEPFWDHFGTILDPFWTHFFNKFKKEISCLDFLTFVTIFDGIFLFFNFKNHWFSWNCRHFWAFCYFNAWYKLCTLFVSFWSPKSSKMEPKIVQNVSQNGTPNWYQKRTSFLTSKRPSKRNPPRSSGPAPGLPGNGIALSFLKVFF